LFAKWGLGLVATGMFAASGALAQHVLQPPERIIVYLHPSLEYHEFVETLLCSLRAAVTAPVEEKAIEFPLSQTMLATPTQFAVERISEPFMRATAADEAPGTYKFLILPQDLKGGSYNFVFSSSLGGPDTSYHFSFVSTARLDITTPGITLEQRRDTLADRLYKLMIKAVARLSGHQGDGCVMGFPLNLAELDAKTDEFCPEDEAMLMEAGILRHGRGRTNNCLFLSQHDPLPPVLFNRAEG